MNHRSFRMLTTAALTLAASSATAHAVLTSPEPRMTGMEGSSLKARPCGQGIDEVRSATVTTFQAGQTITLGWQETIPHPGYFRISFDPDGQHFVDPPTPRATGYSDTVLADVIYPSTPAEAQLRWGTDNVYSFQVTLPDTPCDRCTLQLIEFMEDKLQDGNPDNDIYYSCADLILVAAPADEGAPDASPDAAPDAASDLGSGTPDAVPGPGGTCQAQGAGTPVSFLPMLLAFGILATFRRRLSGSRRHRT